MTHFIETPYKTVGISGLWRITRFVTIDWQLGRVMLFRVKGDNRIV